MHSKIKNNINLRFELKKMMIALNIAHQQEKWNNSKIDCFELMSVSLHYAPRTEKLLERTVENRANFWEIYH